MTTFPDREATIDVPFGAAISMALWFRLSPKQLLSLVIPGSGQSQSLETTSADAVIPKAKNRDMIKNVDIKIEIRRFFIISVPSRIGQHLQSSDKKLRFCHTLSNYVNCNTI